MTQATSPPPTTPRGVDVEAIRLPAERHYVELLERSDRIAQARDAYVPKDPATIRRQLLGASLRLSAGMAPELHARARAVLDLFGVQRPFEIYQSSGRENAAIHFVEDPVVLEVQGGLITLLDPGSMTAVLGHEIGHYLAHGPWMPMGRTEILTGALIRMDGVPDAIRRAASALSIAQELTADRFGVLACRDLKAALRLEMIATTGLPGSALTWDTDAYLAQSRELIDECLRGNSPTLGTTHPEHSVRAYAAWLFSETTLFKAATGIGPGTRRIEDVNDVLTTILSRISNESDVHIYDAQPKEFHLVALACCVMVAHADGDFGDLEAEAIERVFAPIVADFREYLDLEKARTLFEALRPALAASGQETHLSLFHLLVHVVLADGVVDGAELATIVSIGRALGCEALYRSLIQATLRELRVSFDITTVATDVVPLPPREGETRSALDAYLNTVAMRGGAEVTFRRLLRLVGASAATDANVYEIARSIAASGLVLDGELHGRDIDAMLDLYPRKAVAPAAGPKSTTPVSAQRLVQALTKLRDALVSGDGRSPSVRLRECRRGRAYDLAGLESVSVGLSERVLAQLLAGREARLIKASEAGSHPAAASAADALLELDRENRSRREETGANDLAVGYPFLMGLAGGYLLRGPLLLYPVDLVRDARGARGYSLKSTSEHGPIVNTSLLRVLFAKRGFSLSDELVERLQEVAGNPDGAFGVLKELAEAGVEAKPLRGQLESLGIPPEGGVTGRPDHLAVEECAVLGLFPLSSSDLLQDYDGLIATLSSGAAPGATLAAAVALLPVEFQEAIGTTAPLAVAAAADAVGVPALSADPSQLEVLARSRSTRALVVDGPPGTGKSQVIVNLVADALGRGERVAVVSEKRAALDVVAQRLQSAGLEGGVALVHDVQDDRKAVYRLVAARLEAEAAPAHDPSEAPRVREELGQITGALDKRIVALARKHEGSSLSLGNLHTLSMGIGGPLFRFPALGAVDEHHLVTVSTEAVALRAFVDLFANGLPWSSNRKSLASATPGWLSEMDAIMQRSLATAGVFEQWRAVPQMPPLEAIAPVVHALTVARASREGRTDASDGALFAAALVACATRPDAAAAIAVAETEWAQASDALQIVPTRVAFEPGSAAEHAFGVLLSKSGSFFRFFSFAWWRARGVARTALARAWPERAGVDLDRDQLHLLLSTARASRAWRAAEWCFTGIGVPHLLGTTRDQATAAVERIARICRALPPLLAARSALQAAGAWLHEGSVEALAMWDRAVDARLALLAAADAHRATSTSVVATFPWVSALPSHGHLTALLAHWRKDASRVVEYDRRLATLGHHIPDAAALFHTLRAQIPAAGGNEWSGGVVRAWAEEKIAIAHSSWPDVRDLDAPTRYGDEEATAAHLSGVLARATEAERKRILASLAQRPLVATDMAEKGRRRTAAQSAKEAIVKECKKQRRLLPLRTFVRKFSTDGLLDAVPVWLLSPETMAVLFPREPLFDLVIFDEASQCTVENGLPALVRAKRWVIAGDDKQMPPSSFFSAKAVDDEAAVTPEHKDARDVFDAESLLTLARARVPHARLNWHYRCRHEELIAFSNHAMYGGSLLTIPSTSSQTAQPALRWEHVKDAQYDAGANAQEAKRVVELVHELLGRGDRPTIGVVTFNLRQRQEILNEVDRRRSADADFASLWDAASTADRLDERPFVKNLENVQGDERDVILFSLGHAPVERTTAKGTERYVPARFGPLGLKGGERRLNVAISRAKRECVIVASFDPAVLSVAKSQNDGPRLFKRFLEFAHHMAHGRRRQAEDVLKLVREGQVASRAASPTPPPGYVPLKAQIAVALQAEGYECEIDVGTSAFRVPLAVVSPSNPAEYVLAIVCDEGETGGAAFDVYVHRPRTLRARGWTVMRVTAREWWRSREEVLVRLRARLPPPALRVPAGGPPVTRATTPAVTPPTSPPGSVAAPSSSLAPLLAASPVFLARALSSERREQVLSAVDRLSSSHNQCTIVAFAAAMNQAVPGRVHGLVAALAEALNLDGYRVIFVDDASQTVRLDAALLGHLYQVG